MCFFNTILSSSGLTHDNAYVRSHDKEDKLNWTLPSDTEWLENSEWLAMKIFLGSTCFFW